MLHNPQTTVARRVYNGMHSGVEFVIRNATEELIAAGMWNNTILVLAGDNVRTGGRCATACAACLTPSQLGA